MGPDSGRAGEWGRMRAGALALASFAPCLAPSRPASRPRALPRALRRALPRALLCVVAHSCASGILLAVGSFCSGGPGPARCGRFPRGGARCHQERVQDHGAARDPVARRARWCVCARLCACPGERSRASASDPQLSCRMHTHTHARTHAPTQRSMMCTRTGTARPWRTSSSTRPPPTCGKPCSSSVGQACPGPGPLPAPV